MKPIISELTVSGFRALRYFSVEGLGRVNLITGNNNTGKSSMLEVLRILTSKANPSVIFRILSYREENVDNTKTEDIRRLNETDTLLWLSSLFTDFPQSIDESKPIQIKADSGRHSELDLTLRLTWLSRERNSEGRRQLIESQPNLNIFELENERWPALAIKSSSVEHVISLASLFRRYPYGIRSYHSEFEEKPLLRCVYASPYGGESTANLGDLWDKIVLSESEKSVVHALQIIDPNISAVSMIKEKTHHRSRTAIVRSKNFQRPIPLRSYGDGLNRLFSIALSLVNAKDGLLLIDEFENGLHHTVQVDVWRVIFRLARKLNVQVFATSHSWDAIVAFQKAASKTPEDDAVLIRLSRKDDAILPTLFKKDELAVVTRDGIEVR